MTDARLEARDADAHPGPRIAFWVRAADVLSLAALGAVLWMLFSGSYRAVAFGNPLTLSSLHALFAAALLLTIRHAAVPRPSLLARTRLWSARISSATDLHIAAIAFVSRPIVLFVGYLAVVSIGVNPDAAGLRSARDPLTDLPFRYDAGWYGGIAVSGYDRDIHSDRQRNNAFFPAYPLLMRGVGASFGMYATGLTGDGRMVRALWSGVAISLAAFFLAMWYLVKLARDVLGDARAAAPALLLAAYPFAVFFSAPYTESLFLLGTIAAVYHFRRGDWLASFAWGLLVGLTRPNGFFLSAALGLAVLLDVRKSRWSGAFLVRPLAAAAAPAIGMLIFTTYLWQISGVWFAWRESHAAWGRTFHGLEPILRGLSSIETQGLLRLAGSMPIDTLNALALLFALVMIVPVVRYVGAAWAVFVLINILPPLFAGGLMSMGRLTATLFPLFLALGAMIPPRAVPTWTTGFAVVQGLVAALFFTWRNMI